MKIECIGNQYKLTRSDGSVITLAWNEMNCIEEYIRHRAWRSNLEDEIDDNEGNLDFSEISRDAFVDLCIDEMQSKYECCDLGEPDYSGIVFGVAEDNDLWRD